MERFSSKGIGNTVDTSNVDVVRAGIKGMRLLRAQRAGSGPDALLVPEESHASATASKIFHEDAADVVEDALGADELRVMLHEAQLHEVEAIRLAFEKVGLKPPTKALERALSLPIPRIALQMRVWAKMASRLFLCRAWVRICPRIRFLPKR